MLVLILWLTHSSFLWFSFILFHRLLVLSELHPPWFPVYLKGYPWPCWKANENDQHWKSGRYPWACVAHAHIDNAKSYHYGCCRWFHLSSYLIGCYPIIALTTDTSSCTSFWCFVTIEDDDILLSNIREWGCTILLFMFRVMLWVRDGVATIPTTLIIRSSDTEYVDQCVTLTPSIETRG